MAAVNAMVGVIMTAVASSMQAAMAATILASQVLTATPTELSAGNFITNEEVSFSFSLRGRTLQTTLTLQSPILLIAVIANLQHCHVKKDLFNA